MPVVVAMSFLEDILFVCVGNLHTARLRSCGLVSTISFSQVQIEREKLVKRTQQMTEDVQTRAVQAVEAQFSGFDVA